MYYLYSDVNEINNNAFYLAKSNNIQHLLDIVKRCEVKDWTISDNPVNYDENEHIVVDEKFMQKDDSELRMIFKNYADGADCICYESQASCKLHGISAQLNRSQME